MLFITATATVTTAAAIIYGGIKLKDQTQSVTNKVNDFTTQVDDINKNLQSINKSLQTTNIQLQKQTGIVPTGLSGL